MRTALVTGSRGFVGRHISRRLYDDGWDVHGMDLKPVTEDRGFYDVQQDAVRYFRTDGKCKWDLIVHCAALVGGRGFFEQHPLQVAAADLTLDAELFRYVVQGLGNTTVVYYSSSAAYPTALQSGHDAQLGRRLFETDINLDLAENTDGLGIPDHIYGWVKLTGEVLAEHAKQQGAKVHVLRPFSGYGADQDDTYPFPTFIERARSKAEPFDIWGSGYQTRDFIHIDDIVNATMAIYEAQDYRAFNLCTGRPTTMHELADLCVAAVGYDTWHRTNVDAPTGVNYRVGDPTRLHEVYTPMTTLEEAIRDTLRTK